MIFTRHLNVPCVRSFDCARRWFRASLCALGVLLTACGGGTSNDANTVETSGAVTVVGVDGAAVTLSAMNMQALDRSSIDVVRDGTGAPILDDTYVAAGAVYRFSPLGWAAGVDMNVSVPFSRALEAGNSGLHLLVAAPGGGWMEVVDASVEGDHMRARVPALMFATVVRLAPQRSSDDRARTLSAGKQAAVAADVSLGISFNTQATQPPIGLDANGGVITSNTKVVMRVQYGLPSGCSVAPVLSVRALAEVPAGQPARTVLLGSVALANLGGTQAFEWPVSGSDNGTWHFSATVECHEPNRVDPLYSSIVAGPGLRVNIQQGAAPGITAGPADLHVIEGEMASFNIATTGSNLNFQWERSNDGGVSFESLSGATTPSLSIVASLPDDGALFRVRVSNPAVSITSSAAKLFVAVRPVAPSVTSDPASQSVLVGKAANFLVGAAGRPTPSIQWQTRALANADPQFGWSPIEGAVNAVYTSMATDAAQNGRQFRAVLSNAAGVAYSRAATLTVTSVVTAPVVVTPPAAVNVPAGEAGAFAVVAGGTSPFSYQWYRDGVAITGANASSVLVPVSLSDLGSSLRISVQVSNSAGAVRSADALLTVVAARGTGTSSVIGAAAGGVAKSATGDFDVVVPAGALLSDQTITMINQPAMGVSLPEGFTPLGDAIEIGPKELALGGRTRLSWPNPEVDLPEGTVMAIVKLPSSGAKVARARVHESLNVERLALSTEEGPTRRGLAVAAPTDVFCTQAANFTGAGIEMLVSGAGKFVGAAVPVGACTGTAPALPLGQAPSTSDKPCTDADYVSWLDKGTVAGLLSRHVHCLFHVSEVDLSGSKGSYGKYRLEARTGSHGKAGGLSKTLQFSFRLTRIEPGVVPIPATVKIRPKINCSTPTPYAGSCSYSPRYVGVGTSGSWSSPVNITVSFDWSAGDGTANTFHFMDTEFAIYAEGTSGEPSGGTQFAGPPDVRCDKKLTASNSDGCVHHLASAVLAFDRDDSRVLEAVAHIADAQAWGAPGGGFVLSSRAYGGGGSPLQRTWVTGLKGNDAGIDGANRIASCKATDSVIKLRPQSSASCSTSTVGCDCDEYPFNATWNGAWFNKDHTSARFINASHNRVAGARVGSFYRQQRVLDLTKDPGIPYSPGNESASIPSGPETGTDDYWVVVK